MNLALFIAIFVELAMTDDLIVILTVDRGDQTFILLAGADLVVGDKVVIGIHVPIDGYLYLFSCGPVGDVYKLVPDPLGPSTVRSSRVIEGQTVQVGPFLIASPVGDERFLVMFSPVPLDVDELANQMALFFRSWMEGEDMSEFVWRVGQAEVTAARTRGIGTKVHYTPIVRKGDAGPVIIGQITLHSVESVPAL